MVGVISRNPISRGRLMLLLLGGVLMGALSYPLLTQTDEPAPEYAYTIENTFPHDPEAFTQGLVFYGGRIYEGTGLRGHSSVRIVELETGEITRIHKMSPFFFGEGITVHGGRLIQITLQSRVGFIYDISSLDVLGSFKIISDGWGITSDGSSLILSDGTATLRFLDPETFQVIQTVKVRDGNKAVTKINELEYIDGQIFANIWQTDMIARIDPLSGSVLGWIDLGLLKEFIGNETSIDVLNGIAYDRETGHLFLTGKFWPLLFEIKLKSSR